MIDLVGKPFPAFSLQDQAGETHSFESLLGKPTVIYFYPKDDTPGCTVEACEFRDALAHAGTVRVLGVSPDPVKSHAKFAAKSSLNFPLLSDPERTLIEALGLWVEKSMYGKKYMGVDRTTYLLDSEGVVVKQWTKVKPEGHAAEVMGAAAGL